MGFLHDGRERTNGLLAPSTHEPLVDGSAHAPRPAAGATSAARTVAVPRHAEGDASLTPASALLAWLLLVARYNDESHDLASFVWGRTSESGTDMVLSAPRDFVASLRAGSSAEWTLRQAENLLRSALERDTEAAGTTTLRQGDAFFFASSKSSGLLQKPVLHESESSPKYPFRVDVALVDEQLRIQGQWQDSLVPRNVAEQHLDALAGLLWLVAHEPERCWSDALLPLPHELRQLWRWNAVVPPKLASCMHDAIVRRALACPHDLAVSSWDGDLTYGQVEALSRRLAQRLVAGGLAVGEAVPLCFEKSRWALVAVLAVLRAGGAFVLTDAGQPEARLATIVAQTKARVVVASARQEALARRIGGDGVRLVVVSEALLREREPPPPPPQQQQQQQEGEGEEEGAEQHAPSSAAEEDVSLPAVPPDSPMYIVFTSGSTGKPKGVVVSHANYTSGAVPRAEAVGYYGAAGRRVFDFASYAFDVSIDCMLCTAAAGGCVCVPSDAERVDDLGGAIRRTGATMAHMTPSVARVLDAEGVIGGLEVLGLGGEAVAAGDARAWGRLTRVVVAYGPSECTVGCTINADAGASSATGSGNAHLGRGVGCATWIVDPQDHERLVPPGAVGELLVEGPVVGLGYLDEPQKTAESFVEAPSWLVAGDPSAGIAGRRGRLYKTGDLVRYEADGSGALAFVGRKDQQVKIRGQRVELAEIEHHLRDKLPSTVKLAAEVIRPRGGDATLVVFLEEGSSSDSSDSSNDDSNEANGEIVSLSPALRDRLAALETALEAELPRYMVPTAYVPLRRMPSLVSGKTDRKRLRELGATLTRQQLAAQAGARRREASGGSSGSSSSSSPPWTEAERGLQRLWQRLLFPGSAEEDTGIQRSDHFFALGGDSLKAMRLVALASDEGLRLSVATVFRHPTLRDMAAAAERVGRSSDPVDGGDAAPAFSLLPADWTADEARAVAARLCGIAEVGVEDVYPCTPLQEALMALSAKVKEAYVAQRVLDLADEATAQRLRAAFETAAAACPILRTRIVQVPGRGLVQVVVRETIPWRGGSSLAAYLQRDRDEPMELGRPLVRYALIQDEEQDKDRAKGRLHFVFTIHHSLYDGWSMPLVIDRVNRAYRGLPSPSRAPFKDFIRFLQTTDRGASEAFWRHQLRGATGPQFPPLPYEGYQARADALLELSVPLETDQRGLASATTLATVVRAAWALVASRYAGSDDVVFGETLTGRDADVRGAETIEGPMIATVPMRVRVDRGATVAAFLGGLHEAAAARIPFEHAGLQHIRKVSDDALVACELRTGLVLHPAADAAEEETEEEAPASGLVPAGDAEAAQEALKFNTYSVMLVCSLSPRGFLVMASFDSNTVDPTTMAAVLRQFGAASRQLCAMRDEPLAAVELLDEEDREEISRLSRQVADNLVHLGDEYKGATAAWIVDSRDAGQLLPVGAVGELAVETPGGAPSWTLLDPPPSWWTASHDSQSQLYRTGVRAKCQRDGTIVVQAEHQPQQQQQEEDKGPRAENLTPSSTATTLHDLDIVVTDAEKLLRRLWARVLQVDEGDIGPRDNFFRLGGDSIGAMKLASEARLEGFVLTVADIFAHRVLADMASVLRASPSQQQQEQQQQQDGASAAATDSSSRPFSLLDVPDVDDFVRKSIRPALAHPSWAVTDVLPVRPLQELAIVGTVALPRFSLRYEMLHFEGPVDADRLLTACRRLVDHVEILRTVFVRPEPHGPYYAVVLDHLDVPVVVLDAPTDDVAAFARRVCEVDVQERLGLGASFVKFFLVHAPDARRSTLVFRLSHAQYDEICLPLFLRRLAALFEGRGAHLRPPVPFSAYVSHVVRRALPRSLPYWRHLLSGASLTVLRPDPARFPVVSRRHFAVQKTVAIAQRPRDVTVATLPTAAWALCLARRLGLRDVVFGEVVSGRNTGFVAASAGEGGGDDMVAGPCWQYVPVRLRFGDGWTGHDLLEAVQRQHVESAAHEAVSLRELLDDGCLAGAAETGGWFDSVVHQDVEHVVEMPFSEAGAPRCRTETLYLHEEPLREWKVQAFAAGDELTLEIVTVESWAAVAEELVRDLAGVLEELVKTPHERILSPEVALEG